MLPPGAIAPPFALLAEHEGEVRLEDMRGSWVVMWWYPKASTSG